MTTRTYSHQCAGYDGYDCDVIVKYKRKPRQGVVILCASCRKVVEAAHRQEYQHGYYLANREKACAYQREYNLRFKKAERKRAEYRTHYSTTAKKQDREPIKSTYNHSELMHSPTESFEKAINRILSGQADMAAVK